MSCDVKPVLNETRNEKLVPIDIDHGLDDYVAYDFDCKTEQCYLSTSRALSLRLLGCVACKTTNAWRTEWTAINLSSSVLSCLTARIRSCILHVAWSANSFLARDSCRRPGDLAPHEPRHASNGEILMLNQLLCEMPVDGARCEPLGKPSGQLCFREQIMQLDHKMPLSQSESRAPQMNHNAC